MIIKAKTNFGLYSEIVKIIGFVYQHNETYAVTVNKNGQLQDYPISELTVIDAF